MSDPMGNQESAYRRPGTVPRRIVQVAVSSNDLLAIAHDGTLWRAGTGGQYWTQMPSLPDIEVPSDPQYDNQAIYRDPAKVETLAKQATLNLPVAADSADSRRFRAAVQTRPDNRGRPRRHDGRSPSSVPPRTRFD